MTTYRVTLSDGTDFLMAANFDASSSSITANFQDPEDEGAWQPTPYQSATAGHDKWRAAALLIEYFRMSEEGDEVEAVQIDVI